MTLNGFYLIFLYVCEYPRTILPHTNCMKMQQIIVMCTLPTSLHRITLGHKNKHCNINKVICYSCDGKGDTKTADKGVSQTKASRGSVILLSLMNKNTRTVVIMNTVNDGRCISKNRSVTSIASSPSQQFIPLRACSLQPSFLPDILIWAGRELLARFCSDQVNSCICFFFFFPESHNSYYLTRRGTHIYQMGPIAWGCLQFNSVVSM